MQACNQVGQTLYVSGVVCSTGEEGLVCGLARSLELNKALLDCSRHYAVLTDIPSRSRIRNADSAIKTTNHKTLSSGYAETRA
jgi:hypothetical protein